MRSSALAKPRLVPAPESVSSSEAAARKHAAAHRARAHDAHGRGAHRVDHERRSGTSVARPNAFSGSAVARGIDEVLRACAATREDAELVEVEHPGQANRVYE